MHYAKSMKEIRKTEKKKNQNKKKGRKTATWAGPKQQPSSTPETPPSFFSPLFLFR
jgi:hypothetical protein